MPPRLPAPTFESDQWNNNSTNVIRKQFGSLFITIFEA
jgi:hypothetical protein